MSDPLYTVLMPTHYRPDVIGYAIRSILDQTEGDFELFVVGDGAVDGTAEAVLAFDDPRIRWFDLPKAAGYGYANRNIAMSESRGRLIAFAADDDIMLPDHLERLGALVGEPGVQWAYSQIVWVSADGIAAPDLTNLDNADERDFLMTRHNTISGTAIVHRVEAFDTRRAWPEHRTQEADLHMMRDLLKRHGVGAMRRSRVPTSMHFTAGQKSRRDSAFPLLGAFLDLAESRDWWPAELRADSPIPQAEYLRRLHEEPGYLDRLRNALTDIVNRAALDGLAPRTHRSPAEHLADAVARHADDMVQAALVLAEARAERDALAAQLDAVRASTSWRITGPIRRVLQGLRRARR